MRAPSEVRVFQWVKIPPEQRLVSQFRIKSMLREVTNWVMLEDEMYQAITQVNVLSPVTPINVEVDAVHVSGRQNAYERK